MTDRSPFKILSDLAESLGLQAHAKASAGGDDFELILSSPAKYAAPRVTWAGDLARIEEGPRVRHARVVDEKPVVAGVDMATEPGGRTAFATVETGPRTIINTFELRTEPGGGLDPDKVMEVLSQPLKQTEPPDFYRVYLDACAGLTITLGRAVDPPIEAALAAACGGHDRRTKTPPCSRAALGQRIAVLMSDK